MTKRVGFDIKPNGDVILIGDPPALTRITVPYAQLQSIAQNARNLKNAYEQFLQNRRCMQCNQPDHPSACKDQENTP